LQNPDANSERRVENVRRAPGLFSPGSLSDARRSHVIETSPAQDLASAVRRVRRHLIPFLFLLYIFAYLDRINVGFASLQMNEALGFSASTYGLGAGIFFLSYVAFEIPSNIILARVGARLWIARIMITWGLVSASMMFVRTASMYYLLRFLLGLAEAGFFPGIIFYLTKWVPTRERARTIAMFMTATLVAGVVGGPISGALLSLGGVAGLAGWQWLFLFEGLPAVVLGFVVLGVLAERPDQAPWLTDREKTALTACLCEESAQPTVKTRTAGAALRNGRVWILAVVYFTVPVALYAFSFWLPQLIQSSFRGTDFQIGLLSVIPYLVGSVAMVIAGRHSDRTGERRWHVIVAAAVSGAAFIATGFAGSLVPSLLTLSVAMLGLASMFGPFWTLATSFVNGVGAAAGIALINSVGNIGGFVGPYLLGYVKDATQSFTIGLTMVGAIVVLGGLLVLLVPDAGQSE
jgi:ACS family tartrate transporter-like MFS transporter